MVAARVDHKDAGILVIGPAGEKRIRFAVIANNYWRHAGRSGAGAVMGSKNVKALVFYGSQKREVADPEAEKAFAKVWAQKSKDLPVTQFFKNLGTPGMVDMLNEVNAFPSRYWSQGSVNTTKPSTPIRSTRISRSSPMLAIGVFWPAAA